MGIRTSLRRTVSRTGASNPAVSRGSEAAGGQDALARLVGGSHLELIPLKNLAEQAALLPIGSPVSVTCSPAKGIAATMEVCEQLQAAGQIVTPHLSARLVTSEREVEELCAWLGRTGISDVFVIGGDATEPAGPFGDAVALMRALVEAGAPVASLGSAAYPDGHPSIPADVLHRSLMERQELLAGAGIEGWFSTQMCFDPEQIVQWLEATRLAGVSVPVRVGVPGPLAISKLLSLGVRLGIGQSLRYLKKNRSATQLLGGYDPIEVVGPLAPSAQDLGIEGLHVFTFNQVAGAVDWIAEHSGSR